MDKTSLKLVLNGVETYGLDNQGVIRTYEKQRASENDVGDVYSLRWYCGSEQLKRHSKVKTTKDGRIIIQTWS